MRMAFMVLKLFYAVPVYMLLFVLKGKFQGKEKAFSYIKHAVTRMNRAGHVTIESHGVENLPEKDGFVMFPNHQGMFDLMVFLESCPRPFSFVYKKEVGNKPLLKQVFYALNCLSMDREDLRQSLRVIQEMSKRVSEGENFLIFPEGTRSKMGNKLNEMKAGSFKSAVKVKAPIVPCALIDSFVPFDERSLKKVTVKLFYLKPMYYEEYKDMTTQEIAQEVKRRIEETIAENI